MKIIDPTISSLDLTKLKYFLGRAKQVEDCLIWQGALDKAGYGRTHYMGRAGITAHRAVWLASGNTIPQGMELDHICHTRACIKLEHLRVATRQENRANKKYIQLKDICFKGHQKKLSPRGIYTCYICLATQVKKWRKSPENRVALNGQKARQALKRREARQRARELKKIDPTAS